MIFFSVIINRLQLCHYILCIFSDIRIKNNYFFKYTSFYEKKEIWLTVNNLPLFKDTFLKGNCVRYKYIIQYQK